MNGKVEKKVNKMGAMGTRKVGEGETMDIGPTYVIQVPEAYTQEETEEVLDLAMAMPDTAIGSVVVVRDGVHFCRLDDGYQAPRTRKRDPDEDDAEDGK